MQGTIGCRRGDHAVQLPLILSTTKIAPALAAGNTVVHKPAADTPLTALRLAELLAEAGLPDGVLNVVTGGEETGAALSRHPGIDKISFTGSTKVGASIAAAAAATVKPATMELGGKAAHIVFEDADLDAAVEAVVGGFVLTPASSAWPVLDCSRIGPVTRPCSRGWPRRPRGYRSAIHSIPRRWSVP